MGNSESTSYNTGRTQNNRNENSPDWTEIAAGVADLYNRISSSSPTTSPNSGSRFPAVPSSSSSPSSGGSDSIAGWQFPQKGWIKCNVDGSFLPENRSAGCGGVYRDSQGNWLYGFSRKLVYSDLTTAEIDAIYMGLKVAWERGYRKLIVESDSTAAVSHVNKGVPASHHLAVAVNQAREYLSKDWEEIKIVYIFRKYNKVADKLAALSHDVLVGRLNSYYYPPDCCSKFHSDDVSKANSFPRSNDSYCRSAIAAVVTGAAVIAGGYSYLSSSSSSSSSLPVPVLVPDSDHGFGDEVAAWDSDSISCWQFPPKGWVKCNVDGSFLREKRSAGCGGVFRDSQGKWLSGFAEKISYYDNTLAEAHAINRALVEAWCLGYKKVIVESDSESVVNLVNERSYTSGRLAKLVNQAIEYKSRNNWEVQVVHVPQEINKVAHRLARYLSHMLLEGELETYEDPPEDQLINLYLTDGVSGKHIEMT